MQAVPLHLPPGSDLRRSLEEFALAQAATGFVVGVVGDLSRAAFQCPGRPQPTVIEGDLEIITLNGTISPRGVHLHLSLSDGACQVWGGHLEPGTVVRKGTDLLLGLLQTAPMTAPSVVSSAMAMAVPSAMAVPVGVALGKPSPVPASAEPQAMASAGRPAPIRAAAQAPSPRPSVEIAVLAGCPFSARALRMLRSLGIPHQVQLVSSPEERTRVAERSVHRRAGHRRLRRLGGTPRPGGAGAAAGLVIQR
jgi:predicted DNA-binding protein with PD1-like motif